MRRIITSLIVIMAMTAPGLAARRRWQGGTWGEVTTRRKMIDFGPGSSGFGRPGSAPAMRAMAEVRRFVIETDEMRLEMEDTVPIGRRSIDVTIGAPVTFAVEKNAVYVRDAGGVEHKLRLVKKTDRVREETTPQKPAYAAVGGGHLVRAVTDRGRWVTLEDGSRWEIAPRDQYQTVEWEPSANVTVRTLPHEEGGFRYELINTSTDEGAAANYLR